jgi:hypothetical protein
MVHYLSRDVGLSKLKTAVKVARFFKSKTGFRIRNVCCAQRYRPQMDRDSKTTSLCKGWM